MTTGPATLDAILQASDLPERDVEVPEWGLTVKLRGLRRGELTKILDGTPTMEEVNARALSSAMIEPAVTLEQAAQILEEKSMGATQRIIDVILEMNGLSASAATLAAMPDATFPQGADDSVREG